jgi:hypothetical protein
MEEVGVMGDSRRSIPTPRTRELQGTLEKYSFIIRKIGYPLSLLGK